MFVSRLSYCDFGWNAFLNDRFYFGRTTESFKNNGMSNIIIFIVKISSENAPKLCLQMDSNGKLFNHSKNKLKKGKTN